LLHILRLLEGDNQFASHDRGCHAAAITTPDESPRLLDYLD